MSIADEPQREPRGLFAWLVGRPAADVPPDPVRWRRNRGAARRCVERSGLFEPGWYLARNPDVARAGVDPLDHFLDHGGDEGRNPSAEFDIRAYVAQQPDAGGRRVQPLLHFLRYREERSLVPVPVQDRAMRSLSTVPDAMLPPRPGYYRLTRSEPGRGDQTEPQGRHHDIDAIRRALGPLGYRLREGRQLWPYPAVRSMPDPLAHVLVLVIQRDRPVSTYSGPVQDHYAYHLFE